MMALKVVFILAVCFLGTAYSYYNYEGVFDKEIFEDDGNQGPLSDVCISCMCEALGGGPCTPAVRCPGNGATCGMWNIGIAYWQVALDRPDASEYEEHSKCCLNAWCSKRTIQKYMKQKLPDCFRTRRRNSGTDVTVCETALVLHRYGTEKCAVTDQGTKEITNRLLVCLNRRIQATLDN